jgi:hypothetical protein
MVLFSNNLKIAMMYQFSGRGRHLQEKKLHRGLSAYADFVIAARGTHTGDGATPT